MTFGRPSPARFLAAAGLGEERNFSEATARDIDAEVRRLLEEQYARAKALLTRRRPALDRIAGRLLAVETLDRPELNRLLDDAERGAA